MDPRSSIRGGRSSKRPPQFGQTRASLPVAQAAQNVHSKLQMKAASLAGGSAATQASQ
jgi:hypothetical protein